MAIVTSVTIIYIPAMRACLLVQDTIVIVVKYDKVEIADRVSL